MLTQRGLLRLSWQSCHDCAAFGLYDDAALDRLSRIRLLRELGTPLAECDPDAQDRTPEGRLALFVDPFGHRWMLNQSVGT